MAISMGLATSVGLVYAYLSAIQPSQILSEYDIYRGLVLPVVAQELLGTTGIYFCYRLKLVGLVFFNTSFILGIYVLLILILMAVMSTGSSQVIAIASIIVYDIYIPYFQPYAKDLEKGICELCNKGFR